MLDYHRVLVTCFRYRYAFGIEYLLWSKIFGNVLLQRIFNRVAGNFRGMKDVFKEFKVLGRKVALHKINNKCIGNNIYKYKHDFSHLLELVLD